MSPALFPCEACGRHVRSTDAACPFCARPVAEAARGVTDDDAPPRLSRAAMLALAATLTTACPRQNNVYGGPPPPAADAARQLPDPPAPVYGLPPSMLPVPQPDAGPPTDVAPAADVTAPSRTASR